MDVADKNLIVGIGASAGGVEALVAFFRAAPQDSGMAYVVVTHLATGHVSVLDTILARCTTMPVMYAKDGQSVQPNHIYLRPAGIICQTALNSFQVTASKSFHFVSPLSAVFFAA